MAALLAVAGPAAAQRCTEPAKKLGVSRIVEIDTTGGPRFGTQQYKENEFLADGEIVLTFDDGPLRPHTLPIVEALEAQCTKATFFMVGTMAAGDPEMVRQIARRGHTIGTHTWSHANLRKLNPIEARREVEMAFSLVQKAAGQPIAPFFRFPFLADSRAMMGHAQNRNLGVFSIEIDAYDYKTKNAASVHKDVLDQLAYHKKGIILFHDVQPATAEALPGLLAALKARGFRVVHLVSRTPLQTLAEFDGPAQRELNAKRLAAANQPLAPRGLTWPMPAPQQPGAGGNVFAGQPPPRRGGYPGEPLPGAQGGALPGPGQGAAGEPLGPPIAVLPPPPPRQPRPPREPQRDWRDQVFSR